MKYLSKIINARLAVDKDKNVTGHPILNHSLIEIGVLLDSNFQNTISPAGDHIGKILHPNQTQKTKAHHNRFTHSIPLTCNNQITGAIATAIGIFHIKAEVSADHHNKINPVNNIFHWA